MWPKPMGVWGGVRGRASTSTSTNVISRRDRVLAWVITLGLTAAWLADHYHPMPTGPITGSWVAALPWIASAVGALVSAYGAKKASAAQNNVANQQGALTQLQTSAASKLMPWGQNLMEQGGAGLTSLLPYYTKAAFGDRATLSNLVAPELQQIREGYDRPLQSLTELSPRTGTTAASNAAILSGRGDALARAYTDARTRGMQGLQSLSGQLAGLGTSAEGAAFGGLAGASQGNLGLLSQLFNIRNQNNQQSSQIGAGLVDFLKAYNTYRAGGAPPPATPAVTPTPPAGGGWGAM